MRTSRTILSLLIPALLAMNGCIYLDIDGFGRFDRDFHFSYPMKAGGRLSLDGFNGGVEISAWDENTIDISGAKYAPTEAQADAMKVDIDHTPDAASVVVERQVDWHGNRGVRFAIKIPRGAIVSRIATSNGSIHVMDASGPAVLRTSNGRIQVEKLHGALDAHTSNGSIDLDEIDGDVNVHSSNGHVRAQGIRGGFEAETGNSSVNAAIERVDRPVRAETHNGSIDLTLPPNFTGGVRAHTNNSSITVRMADPVNAHITAHTNNSSIHSDFETRMRGELRRNDMDGEIGNGGGLIDLSTSNGSIRLLRR